MSMFMKGDPSRRLLELAFLDDLDTEGRGLLIKKYFTVLSAIPDGISQPSSAQSVCPRALKEAAIAANGVIHTILSCPVEFSRHLNTTANNQDQDQDHVPSEAKTIGLSGLDGSVKQNTSARPSEASRKCGASVPAIEIIMMPLLNTSMQAIWVGPYQ